ncbi:MAG: hypothetical protein KY448_11270, partial [Cyanobacteria bacterium 0813]|nr:hypothetical protein [Cyanobacteria bacterium 0813]
MLILQKLKFLTVFSPSLILVGEGFCLVPTFREQKCDPFLERPVNQLSINSFFVIDSYLKGGCLGGFRRVDMILCMSSL